MNGILSLMVAACVVLESSLTAIHTNNGETGNSAKRHVSDDEIIIIFGTGLQPSQPNYIPRPHKPDESLKDIPKCKKKQCIISSVNMSHNMDTSVDPCVDFYEYACGGWRKKGIPGNHAQWSVFTLLAEQIENILKRLIEEQKDSDNNVRKLVYNWYAACMNQEERDRLGARPLQELIHDTMGEQFSPYVPNDFSDKDWNLEEVLAVIHRSLNVFPLFTMNLAIDPRNSSSLTHLSIDQSKPLMRSHDVYLSQNQHAQVVAKAYITLMVTLTKLLGATKHQKVETIAKELEAIFSFEIEMVKAMKAEADKKERNGVKWTIEQFKANLPEFDWSRYFNKLTEGLNNSFHESELVFVEAPEYLAEVMRTLKKTSKGVVANYITWSLIHEYGSYLSSDFHDAYLVFAQKAYGLKKGSELWRRCVRATDRSVDMGVAMLYVTDKKAGLPKESIRHADKMVENIREAFIDNLQTVQWMDVQTKQAAKEKAEAIIQQIGYPSFITNLTLLEEYFSGLKADPKTVFKNRLLENKIRMGNTLAARGTPLSRSRWQMRPTEINAYYSVASNKIVVPAGILHPPFYHFQHPHAMNFGGIGFVVGHELTHGFDSSGAMFDKHGNLVNWWDSTSMEGFLQREKCMMEEYQRYKVQGRHLDGKKTLGENTADNGGLKLAFRAYHKWLDKNDHDSTLPNLGLTPDQLFFLSFAQVWCEKSTPSYALTDLQVDVHSPGKFRVDVTLKNSLDFAKAFQCPVGSPMNPTHKCEVW